MSAQIIDGKAIASLVRQEVRSQVAAMRSRGLRVPGLAVVMVGDNPASAIYVRNKRQACAECGIVSTALDLPQSTSEIELLSTLDALNADSAMDGILVQLPVPDTQSFGPALHALWGDSHVRSLRRVAQGQALRGGRRF